MCSVRPGSGFAFQDRRARDGDCSAAWNQRSETAGADPPALRRAPRCASARAPPSESNAEETRARSDRPRLAARPSGAPPRLRRPCAAIERPRTWPAGRHRTTAAEMRKVRQACPNRSDPAAPAERKSGRTAALRSGGRLAAERPAPRTREVAIFRPSRQLGCN